VEPVKYKGFLLFHRVQSSTPDGNGWDLVIYDTCIKQMVTKRALIRWIEEGRWAAQGIHASPLLVTLQVKHEGKVVWPWERWKDWTRENIADFAKRARVRYRRRQGGDLTFYPE